MKVAIVDVNIHAKNKHGLDKLLQYLQIPYDIRQHFDTFESYDIVISPGKPLSAAAYPSKLFLFGPHFEVLPKAFPIINSIDTQHTNCMYIQPSEWVQKLFQPNVSMPVIAFPFPVDTEVFKNEGRINPVASKEILLYFKARNPVELDYLRSFFTLQNYTVHLFQYEKGYTEATYLEILKRVQFVVWCGCHESQGFALQEALSMNVPILVWNVKSLAQQQNGNRPDIPGTTVSYWDSSCGVLFTESTELSSAFQEFTDKLQKGLLQPRKYIENTLSVKACAERFEQLTEHYLQNVKK